MRVGIVGLGRMGANLARAAIDHGHEVVGYDPQEHVRDRLAGEGVMPVTSLGELVSRINRPRVAHAIGFLDVGTSGGLSGARNGACFMAGGERRHYDLVEPLLKDLAYDDRATLFAGPPGAGHFVKLIHNAIEFGMVESIAEGAEMLSRAEYPLDLPALFDNWNHGSVIRSWLVELMRDGLERSPDLGELSTYVEDTGEVKWVLGWALDRDIPSPVIADSQQALMSYRDLDSVTAKAVALLHNAFGGHRVHGRSEQLVRT